MKEAVQEWQTPAGYGEFTSVCRCSPSRWGNSLVSRQGVGRHPGDTVVMKLIIARVAEVRPHTAPSDRYPIG